MSGGRAERAKKNAKRFVRRLRSGKPLPFRRKECEPGAEAQMDFGDGAAGITPAVGQIEFL